MGALCQAQISQGQVVISVSAVVTCYRNLKILPIVIAVHFTAFSFIDASKVWKLLQLCSLLLDHCFAFEAESMTYNSAVMILDWTSLR